MSFDLKSGRQKFKNFENVCTIEQIFTRDRTYANFTFYNIFKYGDRQK